MARRIASRGAIESGPDAGWLACHGLTILEAFGQGRRERSAHCSGTRAVTSRLVAVDKSLVYRLARTLADHGFLEQNPDTQRYRIGARAFAIGQQYVVARQLNDVALPVLRQLARDHELNAYLGVLLTPRTTTDPAALLRQIRAARRLGYAISDEENLPGVFAVGAPVRDGTGQVVAAISLMISCTLHVGLAVGWFVLLAHL